MRRTNCLIGGLAALSLALGAQTTRPVVSGVVRDDGGATISGVIVTARRADGIASTYPPIVSHPTDSSGRYAFDNLERGIYVFGVTTSSVAAPMPPGISNLTPGASIRGDASTGVTIVDRDGRAFVTIAGPVPATEGGRLTTLYAPAFHGGAAVFTRGRVVQVDPDRPGAAVDIVVPQKTALRVAGLLTTVLPQGSVETGAPQRLVVRLLPADTPVTPPRGAASDAQPIATALADERGAFVFPAVAAGEYVIDAYRAMPPPTVSASTKGLPVVTPPDRVDGDPQGLAVAQPITLEKDVDDLRLTLRPWGPASRAAIEARAARGARGGPPVGRTGGTGAGGGRALPGGPRGAAAIAGRLVDDDGAPLAGVQIFAAQARGNDLLVTGPAAITDADGRYRLGGLAPDSYAVVAPAFVPGIRAVDFSCESLTPVDLLRRREDRLRHDVLSRDGRRLSCDAHRDLGPGSRRHRHRPAARACHRSQRRNLGRVGGRVCGAGAGRPPGATRRPERLQDAALAWRQILFAGCAGRTLHAEIQLAPRLAARRRDAPGHLERRPAPAFAGAARVDQWTRDDRRKRRGEWSVPPGRSLCGNQA